MPRSGGESSADRDPRAQAAARTAATEAYQNQQARYEEEARERAERKQQAKEAERARLAKIAKDKEDKAAAKRKGQPKSKRPPFNFDQVRAFEEGRAAARSRC